MALQRTRGLSAAQFLSFAGCRSEVQPLPVRRSPLNAVALGRLKTQVIVVSLVWTVLSLVALGDALLVYGDGWSFMVAEPHGWHGDTASSAAQYQVNIVFFPETAESRRDDVTIRVRVNGKTDESIADDLKADMNEYRKKYKRVQFADLKAEHPRYPLVSKLFFVPREFFEYVAYVNPGTEYPYVFSVALSKANRAATPAELAAYQEILGSVLFMHKAP